jgi:hypothetical protein
MDLAIHLWRTSRFVALEPFSVSLLPAIVSAA